MHFLIRAALLCAAGAAGWALARRKNGKAEPQNPQIVYLDDEQAVIDAPAEAPEPAAAEVVSCFRRMDPLTLCGASEATFLLLSGEKIKLTVKGDGGLHLAAGEKGWLTWSGNTLIRFEKENGDVISGMFYAPAEEAHDDA